MRIPKTVEIIEIVLPLNKKTGMRKIRKTKPDDRKSSIHGDAAYVWRMLAFQIGLTPQTICLPMMADCYIWADEENQNHSDEYWKLGFDSEERKAIKDAERAYLKSLDYVVDAIMARIPMENWNGVKRWGRALGY